MKLLYSVAWPGQGIYTKEPLKTGRPEGDEVPHLQPDDRAPRRAAWRQPDRGAGARSAADVRDRRDPRHDHLVGYRHSTKAWEFVKNYYMTSAMHPKNVVVVNQRGFSRLPKDQQDAVMKAAATAETRGWDMSKAREKEGNETLAKNGMSVRDPDPAMKEAFAKVGQQMTQEWGKAAGADGAAILKAYRLPQIA